MREAEGERTEQEQEQGRGFGELVPCCERLFCVVCRMRKTWTGEFMSRYMEDTESNLSL